jgi:hypothetical protein
MRQIIRCAIHLGLVVPVAAIALSGCATQPETTYWNGIPNATPATTSTTYATTSTVTYPNGMYKVYVDDAARPYWVWVPKGVTMEVPPPPPAIPTSTQTAVVVQQPAAGTQTAVVVPQSTSSSAVVIQPGAPARSVAAGKGQYVLYGDGAATPYYWVWTPAGVTAPPPPLPPRP